MSKTRKHSNKKWELSIMEFQNCVGKKYKVTIKIPEMSVTETKVFRSKKRAKKKFDEWLK